MNESRYRLERPLATGGMAELFLGVAMLAGARWTRTGPLARVVPVAAVIALAYTGAAAVSWLLLEQGLLT